MIGTRVFHFISEKVFISTLTLVLLAAMLSASGCSGVRYVLHVSRGQMSLYNHERGFEEVYQDPLTSTAVKDKLHLVTKLKKYVEAQLGVTATKNYTTYVALKRPYVSYVVVAAKPNEVKAHNWCFPIAGCFPYLGFFDEEMAKSWARDFAIQGFETYVRGASAYSTLGYLRDPLLSSMLQGDDADLVNLLFHETTHGYVYVSGHGDFNEGLASAIGDYGEKIYIEQHYGATSKRMERWVETKEQGKKFSLLIRASAQQLDKIYSGSTELLSEDVKVKRAAIFAKLQQEVSKLNLYSRVANQLNNNAELVAHLTYDDQSTDIQELVSKCEAQIQQREQIPRCILDAARQWKPEKT